MKRPAFQFYPADWRKDSALQACSLAARGLWMELMCIAHECEPYGFIAINGKPMTVAQIARLVGESQTVTKRLLCELEQSGVFSRDDGGAIYSRRMVKDEHIREVRADAGRLGGNPNLLKQKVKQMVNHAANQDLTPSSSASASALALGSSSQEPSLEALGNVEGAQAAKKRGSRLPPDWKPSESEVAWARAERPGMDVRHEAAKFRDFWIAKAGRDGVKLDWPATWRNWVRNARSSPSANHAKPPIAQEFSAKTYTGTTDDELPESLRTGTH